MNIKYYRLAKGETPPEEFCAVRDVGGEPSEYVFYVPESDVAQVNRYEQIVVRRIVEVRSEMLDAIHANDVNQYDSDIQAMRHTIDELLDLLVEFNRPVEKLGVEVDG